MDYVYICGPGENEELRYSIRSLVKNAPAGSIWVIGNRPDWYVGNFVHVDQDAPKYVNARNNLKALCDTKEISEDFVLMNDDFFVIKPINHIGYFHGGSLEKKALLYEDLVLSSSYTRKLQATHGGLLKKGVANPLDYELHVPMPMNKGNLRRCLTEPTILWRSLYGNTYVNDATQMEDVKVYLSGPLVNKSYDLNNLKYDYLSSDATSFKLIKKKILGPMLQDPSPYESPQLESNQRPRD